MLPEITYIIIAKIMVPLIFIIKIDTYCTYYIFNFNQNIKSQLSLFHRKISSIWTHIFYYD